MVSEAGEKINGCEGMLGGGGVNGGCRSSGPVSTPGPSIHGAFDTLQVDLMFGWIPSRAAGNDEVVTGSEGVFGDALATQALGVVPFGRVQAHFTVRVLGHYVEPCVGASEIELEQFTLDQDRIVFEVKSGEGVMGPGGNPRKESDKNESGQ